MGKEDEDNPFPGLSHHLDNMRLDKAVKERIKDRLKTNPDEPPTNPGVPRAKAAALKKRCIHRLRLMDCEDCRLRSENAGRYALVGPDADPSDKKED